MMKEKDFDSSSFKEKLGMMKNFASAVVSRGFNNKKIDEATKQLRVLSCFGDNKELPACEYLKNSKTGEILRNIKIKQRIVKPETVSITAVDAGAGIKRERG